MNLDDELTPELADLLTAWEQAYDEGDDLPPEALTDDPELRQELAEAIPLLKSFKKKWPTP